MKTIKENVSNTIVINKSKFICFLYKVNSLNDINEILKKVRLDYSDATHHCYGYILDNYIKCSDDNEPSGTAGKVILNVLSKNNLDHILCIVVRYFGGIKLGAGGLVRAYSNSVIESLNKTSIIDLINSYLVEIVFDYNNTKIVDNILKSYDFDKIFNDLVTYTLYIPVNEYDNIKNKLINNIISITIKENVLI